MSANLLPDPAYLKSPAELEAWDEAQRLRGVAAADPSFDNMEAAVDAWRAFKRLFMPAGQS